MYCYYLTLFHSLSGRTISLHFAILHSISPHSISRIDPLRNIPFHLVLFHTGPYYFHLFSLNFIPRLPYRFIRFHSSYFRSSQRTFLSLAHTRNTSSLFHVSLSMSCCGSFPFQFSIRKWVRSQSLLGMQSVIRYACVLAQKSGKLLPATTSETPFSFYHSLTLSLSLSAPTHTMAGLLISVAQKMAAASANFADNENRVVLSFHFPFLSSFLVICKVVQKLSSKVTIFSYRGLCLLPAGG